jgi:hypothetical protein
MDVQEVIENVLAHHGVKGMRWGVRRERTSRVTVSQSGKKLKAAGGFNRKASSDAVTAKKLSQIKKKSGVSALSNDDLQAYQRRLNLEQNVRNLEVNQPGVRNYIKRLMTNQGNQTINKAAQSAAKKAGKAALAAA